MSEFKSELLSSLNLHVRKIQSIERRVEGWFIVSDKGLVSGPYTSLDDISIVKVAEELKEAPEEVLEAKLTIVRELKRKEEEEKPPSIPSTPLIDIYRQALLNSDKRLKMDETTRKLCFLTALSNYTDNPLNLFLRGPSGIGKTVLAVIMTSYFPQQDVWSLGGMSPKALTHEKGECDMITGKWVVSLWNKVLLFLDAPDMETLDMLKPILSHDKTEIEHKFVDKSTGQTITVIIRGFPSTIFCTTQIEFLREWSRRGLTVTPEISNVKFKGVLELKGIKTQHPWIHLETDLETEEIRKNIEGMKPKGDRLLNRLHIVVPYGLVLSNLFPTTDEIYMSEFDKFNALIGTITQTNLNNFKLRKIVNGETTYFTIASLKDYKEARNLYSEICEATVLNIPSYIIKFFNDVLIPLGNEASFEAVRKRYLEAYGRLIGKGTLSEMMHALEGAGWIIIESDLQDRRKKVAKLVRTEKIESASFLPQQINFTKEDLKKWLRESLEETDRIMDAKGGESTEEAFIEAYV